MQMTNLHVFQLCGFDVCPGEVSEKNRPKIQQKIINDLLLYGFFHIVGGQYETTEKGKQYVIEFRLILSRGCSQ